MGLKKPTRRSGASHKQKKKKQIPKSNLQQKGSNVKQPKSGKALIIAQEIKFARLLASKDKKVRDKVLKNLKKWLTVRSHSSFGKCFNFSDYLHICLAICGRMVTLSNISLNSCTFSAVVFVLKKYKTRGNTASVITYFKSTLGVLEKLELHTVLRLQKSRAISALSN